MSLFDAPVEFAPTPEAARERLARVDPAAYARTRNALDGAVSALSPYITHGLLSLPEVMAGLRQRIGPDHKFVFELAWREYFHHVWRHEGEAIFSSLHAGPLPDHAYARELPADLREARTGIPAIDAAVRRLYATGWLHNHARMWLASYVVHDRRVHWRAGADWLYGHLLDGDLASNHLSWQWVAGTGSHRPYLFNADNVARHAGAHLPEFDSRGTAIDAPYAAREAVARGAAPLPPGPPGAAGVAEPALCAMPPTGLAARFTPPDPAAVAGRDVWLLHPWQLADPPAGALAVAVWDPAFHARWPWSERRWRFALGRLAEIGTLCWQGPAEALVAALSAARSVAGVHNPHLPRAFEALPLAPPARLHAEPRRRCHSFSAFWRSVGKPEARA